MDVAVRKKDEAIQVFIMGNQNNTVREARQESLFKVKHDELSFGCDRIYSINIYGCL